MELLKYLHCIVHPKLMVELRGRTAPSMRPAHKIYAARQSTSKQQWGEWRGGGGGSAAMQHWCCNTNLVKCAGVCVRCRNNMISNIIIMLQWTKWAKGYKRLKKQTQHHHHLRGIVDGEQWFWWKFLLRNFVMGNYLFMIFKERGFKENSDKEQSIIPISHSFRKKLKTFLKNLRFGS